MHSTPASHSAAMASAVFIGAISMALLLPLGGARVLSQTGTGFSVGDLSLADFDAWPSNGQGTVPVPDASIGVPINVAVSANSDAGTYGAYVLGAQAAQAISDAISSLPRVTLAASTPLPEVGFPAPTAAGRPGDATPAAAARLPSVLDLSRSGHVFRLAATVINPAQRGFDPTPDTVQLIFSDMLVHTPGEVYSEFERNGIPYVSRNVEFGNGARICYINSMFIMRSCSGFNDPQILCCSVTACRGYTQAEYVDTGFPLPFTGTLPNLACYPTDPAFVPAPPPSLPTGAAVPPNEDPIANALVHAVNFATWPEAADLPSIVSVDENRLTGRVPIRSFQTDVLPGAFTLNTLEATRLAEVTLSQLPEVPAWQAVELTEVPFPGVEARGGSRGGGIGPRSRRIPTVYAPFHSGFRFRIDDDDGKTAIVNLSNMTILVPNATYEGLGSSGLLDFFSLGDGQPNDLVCVQNSIFVLESCEGFRQAQFELWCCNTIQCNREFTSDFLLQVGVIQTPLEPLTCVEIGALSYSPAPPGGTPPRRGGGLAGARGDTGVMDNGATLLGMR
eukprot:jgi/Ulvmu1/1339/UM011_0067.1